MNNYILKSENVRGLTVELGKTYWYYNKGLSEYKQHYVKRIEGHYWAVDSDGRVPLDSLYESYEDLKNSQNQKTAD